MRQGRAGSPARPIGTLMHKKIPAQGEDFQRYDSGTLHAVEMLIVRFLADAVQHRTGLAWQRFH